MKNTLFKKRLVVGIIILFVGVSVLSSASSANDISVSKKIKVDKKIIDYSINVFAIDNDTDNGIMWVKVTLTSKDGSIKKVEYTKFGGACSFKDLPAGKSYGISAYKPRWEVVKYEWSNPYIVAVYLHYKGKLKNLNTPFLNWLQSLPNIFPIIRQLLRLQ